MLFAGSLHSSRRARRAAGESPGACATIARFSALVAASDLAELELNPLVVGPAQVIAVDARAVLNINP